MLEQAGIESRRHGETASAERTRKARQLPGTGATAPHAYRGAQKVEVPHASLKAGDACPECRCGGKVYAQREPGVLVRVMGQAPLAATVYELEKLRCNLCGEVFTAAAPEGVGEKKYDETAATMIALLKYGSGCSLEPAGRTGSEPGHSAAGGHAVGDRGGNRRPRWSAGARGTDPPGGAGRGGAQRRHDDARAVAASGMPDIAAERTGVFTTGIVCDRRRAHASRCSSPAASTPARTWPRC